MKLLLLSACILAAANAQPTGPIAWANLTTNGARGYVKVYGGKVMVSLDLNNFDWTMTPASTNKSVCMKSGLTYHIHFARFLPTAAVGSRCAANYTGGHYDPWYACGGATDQKQCANKGGCITRSYMCDPTRFAADPFTCEVGDWSGKYGKLWPLDGMGMNSTNLTYAFTSGASRFEVSAANLYNPLQPKAVVFHCGSPRILCAPFRPNIMMNASLYATGPGVAAATTKFSSDLGSVGGPYVEFGGGQMSIGGPAGMTSILAQCLAMTPPAPIISMAIMSNVAPLPGAGTQTGLGINPPGACTLAIGTTGGVYDPTFGCVPGSDAGTTGQCQGQTLTVLNDLSSTRCPNQAANMTFNYTEVTLGPLNPTADPYLSSQGALLPYIHGMTTSPVNYRVMRQDASLVGKVFLITCGMNAGTRLSWCSPIVSGATTPVTPPTTTNMPPPMMNTTGAPPPASTSGCGRAVVFVGFVVALLGMVVV